MAVARNYWLDLFTEETWEEFLEAGGGVSGFSPRRPKAAEGMRPGDYLLCCLTGTSRFVGVLEVTGKASGEADAIRPATELPARVPVRVVHALQPETAVPIIDLRDQLSVVVDLRGPDSWSGASEGSPTLWKQEDGELVLAAIREALAAPEAGEEPPEPASSDGEAEAGEAEAAEALTHTDVQGTLLKLGTDMGLRVWVARDARGRLWKGTALGDLPGCLAELPLEFDEAALRVFELIDVLWLDDSAIVAAFDVVGTAPVYSGLLRMADLVAMQPGADIRLYFVGPEDRRAKVLDQVNRPTFSRLPTPLGEVSRYIAFSRLEELLGCIRDCETPDARLLA